VKKVATTPIKISGRMVKPLPEEYTKTMQKILDEVYKLLSELGGPDDYFQKFTLKWDEKRQIWILKFKAIDAIHNHGYELSFYF